MESRGDDSSGKIAALEAELRRTKDRLAESQVYHHVFKEINANLFE